MRAMIDPGMAETAVRVVQDSSIILDDTDLCEQPPAKLAMRMNPNPMRDQEYPNHDAGCVPDYIVDPSKHGRACNSSPTHVSQSNGMLNDVCANHMQNSSVTNGLTHTSVSQAMEKMSRTNLYIKGLPDSFNDEKLWNLPPHGDQIKSVKAATDDDGRCRGYGFIDFICEEAANEALRHIRDTYPAFTIKFAKENEKDKTNLYVTNLPKSWTTKDSDQLKMVFERFGTIQSSFVMMERSTNRTTGVGFVRYSNERDALNALDCIKNDPIILPDCTIPVEAKFADKHNPDTRRRRFPMSNMLNQSGINGLIGYPLSSICPTTQEPFTALLNNGLPIYQPPSNSQNNLINMHTINSKTDYNRLTQNLFTNHIPGKFQSTSCSGLSDFGLLDSDAQLNALAAAAASALIGSQNGSSFMNTCFRPSHAGQPNTIAPTLTGNLVSNTQLSLLGANPVPAGDASILDPNVLYRCSVYGSEFYRHTQQQHRQQQQQQQQQQLLAAAMSTLNNAHSGSGVYPGVSDLTPYLGYINLLSPQQTAPLNNGVSLTTPCLTHSGSPIGPIFGGSTNGLIATNSLLTNPTPLSPESMGLLATRSTNGLQPWLIPTNQMMKNGGPETVSLVTQSGVMTNNSVSTMDRDCKQVQLFI